MSSADSDGPDIEAILAEVLVRTDPSQRASYLDQACAVHPEVRQQVEQWAQLIEETVDCLESPTTGLEADSTTEPFVLPSEDELAAHLAATSISIRARLASAWARIKQLFTAKGEKDAAEAPPRNPVLESDGEETKP